MIEPKESAYLDAQTKIEQDAIEKGLEVVRREVEKIEGPVGDDVRWYMDVIRSAIAQKDTQIRTLADVLEKVRPLLRRTQPEFYLAGDALLLAGRKLP